MFRYFQLCVLIHFRICYYIFDTWISALTKVHPMKRCIALKVFFYINSIIIHALFKGLTLYFTLLSFFEKKLEYCLSNLPFLKANVFKKKYNLKSYTKFLWVFYLKKKFRKNLNNKIKILLILITFRHTIEIFSFLKREKKSLLTILIYKKKLLVLIFKET